MLAWEVDHEPVRVTAAEAFGLGDVYLRKESTDRCGEAFAWGLTTGLMGQSEEVQEVLANALVKASWGPLRGTGRALRDMVVGHAKGTPWGARRGAYRLLDHSVDYQKQLVARQAEQQAAQQAAARFQDASGKWLDDAASADPVMQKAIDNAKRRLGEADSALRETQTAATKYQEQAAQTAHFRKQTGTHGAKSAEGTTAPGAAGETSAPYSMGDPPATAGGSPIASPAASEVPAELSWRERAGNWVKANPWRTTAVGAVGMAGAAAGGGYYLSNAAQPRPQATSYQDYYPAPPGAQAEG